MSSFSFYIAFKQNDVDGATNNGVAADDSVTVGKDPFVANIEPTKPYHYLQNL